MRLLFALVIGCFVAIGAIAQSNTGRLVGTVSNASGVVPGATVTVVDNNTGKERTVVTTGEGSFTFTQLEVGTYTVKVTAQGHKTFTANAVKIDVGKDFSLDVPLEAGDISENVEVVAGADTINSANGELSNTVSPRQIQDLPLNGRDPTALITLQAGTASNGSTNTAINGQRSSFTNITRDGINIQDNYIRANASDFSVQSPKTDNVNEFTLTTQNASADQGYGASQVQFVTPRGQNEFHGGLFWYNRNSKFAANSFFNNSTIDPDTGKSLERVFLNRNQFGGKLGGPIIKNKLFFFGNFEAFLLRTQTPVTRTVLTPGARTGNFTWIDNSGVRRTVNLFSQFGGSTGITSIDPTVNSRILSRIPTAGNSVAAGDGRNTSGFRFNQRSNFTEYNYVARIDYDINERHALSGVYSYTDQPLLDRPDADGGDGYNGVPTIEQPSNRTFLSLAYRYSPAPNWTNELRAGLFVTNPTFLRRQDTPNFFIIPTLVSNPDVTFENQGRDSDTYSIQDTADYIWGNHSLRFGGQAQFFRFNAFSKFTTVPTYTLGLSTTSPGLTTANFASLGGIDSTQLATANALLALYGGVIDQADQTFNVTSRDSGFVPGAPNRQIFAYEHYGFFFADQWRVRPDLTLNLGVRYDLFTPLRETRGLLLEPVIPQGSALIDALLNPNGTVDFLGANGRGKKIYNTDTNNFSPILTFAYAPNPSGGFWRKVLGDGKTVFRGGFRMSYVNDELVRGPDNALEGNDGLSQPSSLTDLDGRLSALPSIPTPTPFTYPRTYADANDLTGFSAVFAVDPNIQTPKTIEYSFGIQREIGSQMAFEIRYVGGRSNNLARGIDFNQVDIVNNGFLADFNRARNNLLLTGNPACTPQQDSRCQTLTVFPQLIGGGFLGASVVRNQLRAGTVADLAILYQSNLLQGNVQFLQNPNAGPVDLLGNFGRYRYNSLQAEFRRRFSKGLYFQANYTFQKTLTDASGVGQTKFEPNLDNAQPNLEYARADYDQTHVFNFNTIYELPFGKGKRWLNEDGWADRVIGGWHVTSIIRAATGAPLTFVDSRGTLNRAGRSGRQTPQTSLTTDQIKDLIGVYRTPCGVYFINPSVINIDPNTCSGRAANGFGSTPFNGQVFFNNAPGQTGSLARAFVNGPFYFNWDASIIKNIPVNERLRLQFRAEAFNVINRANFFPSGQFGAGSTFNINSPNFGRLSETFSPRIMQFALRVEF